ncbi:SRPBCC family protein [Archangium violaceum]|uniref:SRPBCC family protein n=1 Tax=Archangium violaceum TaxID=83451 RepID=UPI002B2F5CE1|nr:SRPBCC family protein [Archangium gephyra]
MMTQTEMTKPANKVKASTPSEREVRTERIFNAPRERVWKAFTDPKLLAQWWGRGNKLVIERMELVRGGHWRFVEHAPEGVHGFEGRYREVTPPERIVQSFEWDGMPGYVCIETMTMEDLGDGRTRVVSTTLFHTKEERDGMLNSGMTEGLEQGYAVLDRLLETMA